MTKLKPCPFCGGKVELMIGEAGLEKVFCPVCGTRTLWTEHAHQLWNKRTRKNTNLKPCPFCGHKAKVFIAYDGKSCVQCTKCGLTSKGYDFPRDAEAVWNARIFDD